MARWVLAAVLWLLTALWKAMRIARRFFMAALVAILLVTNVLAFTSAAFVSLVSGAASAVGMATVQARSAMARRAVVRRVATRTTRGAIRSAGGTVAQALPVVGVASVVGLTAWELRDACETLEDLADLEPGVAGDADTVCGLTPPTVAEVEAAVRASATDWTGATWRWITGAGPGG